MLHHETENKNERPCHGPYTILKVNDNGTVRFKVKNVEDTYNIHRYTPYLGTDNIDHGGECSMRTSRVKRRDKMSQMSPEWIRTQLSSLSPRSTSLYIFNICFLLRILLIMVG
jgi:hypothetical protein